MIRCTHRGRGARLATRDEMRRDMERQAITRVGVWVLMVATVVAVNGLEVTRAAEQSWVELAVHNFGEPINTMWAEGELSFADDGTMVYCSAREDLAVAPGDRRTCISPPSTQIPVAGRHR